MNDDQILRSGRIAWNNLSMLVDTPEERIIYDTEEAFSAFYKILVEKLMQG